MEIKKSSRLLIDEHPLVVMPSLAVKLGLNEAIILQQINYWLQNTEQSKKMNPTQYNFHNRDGRIWIYNTLEAWYDQFPFFSPSTIWRTINKLEELGVLLSAEYNKISTDRTKWYSIDYDKLDSLPSKKPPRKSKHDKTEESQESSKIAFGQVDQVSNSAVGQVDQLDLVNLTSPFGQVDQLLPEITTETTFPETTKKKTTTIHTNTLSKKPSTVKPVVVFSEEEDKLRTDMVDIGVDYDVATALIKDKGVEACEKQLNYCKLRKNVYDPAGWVVNAIKKAYVIKHKNIQPTQYFKAEESEPVSEEEWLARSNGDKGDPEVNAIVEAFKKKNNL